MTVTPIDRTREILAESRPCKTPGCLNDANVRYDRGPLSGLCEEVCIDRRRAKIREDAVAGAQTRGDRQTPRADGSPSLAGLAAATVPAARDLEKKLARRREAGDEARDALAAFKVAVDELAAEARRLVGDSA